MANQLTHPNMETLIGNFIDEAGADRDRYPQADRRVAIRWAEVEAGKWLPIEKLRILHKQVDTIVVASGLITYASCPADMRECLSIFCDAVSLTFEEKTADEAQLMRYNQNWNYGYYWWNEKDGGIRIKYASSYDPLANKPSMMYRSYPNSWSQDYAWGSVCEIEGYEVAIAKGAAGYLLLTDDEMPVKGGVLRKEFYQELGVVEPKDGNDN
jgi:hypothetical protein